MMLTEVAQVPVTALPVAELRAHLRIGTGFADAGAQDAALETCLRAALAAIEGRTGKALIARDFVLVLAGWRRAEDHPLPLAPVSAISRLAVVDRTGTEAVIDPDRYHLVADVMRPRLAAAVSILPGIPVGGRAEVTLTAGFGPWEAVPADLRQAVLMLAAEYYDRRPTAGAGVLALPFGVLGLIERWRTVRVLGGGEA